MNSDIITLNENRNDGSIIHLYYNSLVGVWTAYGLSAYGLRLFGKTYHSDNPRGYSTHMQMPCTLPDKYALDKLFHVVGAEVEKGADYLQFKLKEQVDKDAYARWTRKLRDKELGEQQAALATEEISSGLSLVPKDVYIKDGMSGFERNTKRFTDCILAFIALIVFSPLYLIIWILVRMEDGGPAIFKQERIGRFGRPFYIYKFRSMRMDAEKFGPQLSSSGGENDPRLTKIGKFIRAHHLDELPQLWNVFCGDMSFIGPRPERKFYIDQILEYDKRYEYLYQIRPGVTSYATLYNGYTDTMAKMLRRLEYDLYYLNHRSWWLDFKILFNTFCSIVFGKKF